MFFFNLYAKHWPKREQVDLKYFSEWKDDLKELFAIGEHISDLRRHFKAPFTICKFTLVNCKNV